MGRKGNKKAPDKLPEASDYAASFLPAAKSTLICVPVMACEVSLGLFLAVKTGRPPYL
jgi:hypothetical protein